MNFLKFILLEIKNFNKIILLMLIVLILFINESLSDEVANLFSNDYFPDVKWVKIFKQKIKSPRGERFYDYGANFLLEGK